LIFGARDRLLSQISLPRCYHLTSKSERRAIVVSTFHAATGTAIRVGRGRRSLSVAAIPKNPAYAGAFVYGRTRMLVTQTEYAVSA
jgi:hypothetical protein